MPEFSAQDLIDMEKPAMEPVAQVPEAAKTPSFSEWLGSPEAMALAAGFLKAGGPSPYPVSMAQAMGMGMEEMLKAKLQFGNQKLDKDKFAYQQKHDAQQLDLQNKKFGLDVGQFGLQKQRFGLDEKQYLLQKDLQGAHKSLYEAQAEEAREKVRKNRMILSEMSKMFPGFETPAAPNTPPDSGSSMAPKGNNPGSDLGVPPPQPTPPQGGILAGQPASSAPGILNNPAQPKTSPADLNSTLMKLAMLNSDFRSAGQIYKNQNDWEIKEGVDPQGNPLIYQQNKMTREIQPVQGIMPLSASPALKYQTARMEEEGKNDEDMRKRVAEFAPIRDNFNNIRDTLAKNIKTGAGFETITTLQNFANTLGIDIDKDKLSDKQFIINQIESAFNKYQTGTRVPGIGQQSNIEFEAARKQFLQSDMTPQTLLNVMNAFDKNLQIKQKYIDLKEQWASEFGSPRAKDKNGRTFNQLWGLYEKQLYGGKSK